MEFFQMTFNGDLWTIYLTPDDDHDTLDKDSDAEINAELYEIYFRRGSLSVKNVRHELFHLYVDYCNIHNAELEQGQMEEVACDIFAYRGHEIIEKADAVYAKLLEMKNAS